MSGEGERRPAALFGRPQAEALSVEREPISGACSACGAEALERYPVLQVTGWATVIRCRGCLATAASEPSPTPFGFTYVPYSAALRR